MNAEGILEAYKRGDMTLEEAEKALRTDYLVRIGDDVLFDAGRQVRKDVPEVVFAETKRPDVVARIASSFDGCMLVSRASPEHFEAVRAAVPGCTYHPRSGVIVVGRMPEPSFGPIGVITAGTSDIPAAEEAELMATAMGCSCMTYYDIGVAGMHRLLDPMKELIGADAAAIVVAAGMEGALPTLVSSLSPVPVIGLPVSTGYGMGGKGKAALCSILQSCSPGLCAVNIDNGIGAGAFAAMVARRSRKD
jgi:pyridinium-3,5-biscarboxylic acid mononucleotide synthase